MLVDIDKIQVKDRIRKDFGNIQELADDIKENGLINPPVITPDTYELIAGERRLRAMKELGFKQVEVRPMAVKDAEHALNLEISENETRKDFSKAERIDYARRLERIEELKAKERMEKGDNQYTQDSPTQNFVEGNIGETNDIVAEKLDIGSGEQYRKEKFIVDNKESLSPTDFTEWDEGKLSTNKAFNQIKTKLQEANKENQRLKNVNAGLQMKVDSKQREISDAVANTTERLSKQINQLNSEKSLLERKVKLNQDESDKYKKLKSDIAFLTKQKTDLSRQIESATELAGLTVKLQHTLENDLAPIKYKRCMEVLDSSDTAIKNLSDVIDSVDKWLSEIKKYLPNKNVINTNYKDIKGDNK